jgi:putative ABC transport system substrate-binding protein
LTTPCLQAAAQVKDINIVFSAVFDPYIAGAAKSPEDHAPNITGVGSFPPVRKTIEFIQKVFPDVKRLGSVWCSSELCAEAALKASREVCREKGIEIVELTVTNSNEVLQAAQALADKGIDIFYIVGDNVVLTSFESIVKVSEEQHIPIIMSDPEYVKLGALAAFGFDFYELQVGKLQREFYVENHLLIFQFNQL